VRVHLGKRRGVAGGSQGEPAQGIPAEPTAVDLAGVDRVLPGGGALLAFVACVMLESNGPIFAP